MNILIQKAKVIDPKGKHHNKIRDILITNGKIELIKKIVKTKEMRDYIKFYYLLRTIDKATFKPREEYRKHVTLITPKHEVDVEKVKEFYEKTKEFVGFSHEFKGR